MSRSATTQMGGHTYSNCLYHVIFSTFERREFPLLQMQHLHRYMVGIAKNNNFTVIVIGGVTDHVHLLLVLPTSLPVAKAIQLLKGGSSKWFKEEYPTTNFAWQRGFAAFSVSQSQCELIKNYIRNQEEHHKKRDFAAEFIALLQKNNVPYDPKFVFG